MSVRSGGFPSGLRNLTALNDVDGSVALLNGDGLVYNSTSGLWVPTGVATATRAESHYYADGTSGSDSNNGLTAATPKKTLQAVFDLVPDFVEHNTAVHLTGTFTTTDNPALQRYVDKRAVLLVSGDASFTVVADDGGSPWVADIASTSSIGLTTAGWVVDAYAGYWVEIIDGAAQGQTRMVQLHDGTTVTPMRNYSVSPGAGTQFRIVRPDTTITGTSQDIKFANNGPGIMHVQWLYMAGSTQIGSGYNMGGFPVVLSHIISNSTAGIAVKAPSGSLTLSAIARNTTTFAAESAATFSSAGVSQVGTSTTGLSLAAANLIQIQGGLFKGAVQPTGAVIISAAFGSRFLGHVRLYSVGINNASTFSNSSGYAATRLVSLELVSSSAKIGAGVDISNAAGHGIECNNSRLHLDGAVAGTCVGAGVYAHDGSVVNIKNGSPPTLTGTVGDVSVDGTTPVSSWTDVDADYPVGPAHTTGIAVKGNAVATAIATVNVWVQFLGFDTNLATNGPTPDHTNDHIVIKRAGTYLIEFDVSFSAEADPDTYEIEVQLNNGATSTRAALERVVDAAGDIGAGSGRDILTLAAGDTVELWVRNTTDAHDPTLHNVVLTVREIDSPSEAEGVLVKEV